MKIKDIKIERLLAYSFSIIIILVAVLGVISFVHTISLYKQTETIYKHPLKVKLAVSDLKIDILDTRVAIRDILINENQLKQRAAMVEFESSLADADRQIDILYSLYLGPISDVDRVHESYNRWKTASITRANEAYFNEEGMTENDLGDTSTVGTLRLELEDAIQVIDAASSNKADSLFLDYVTQNRFLNVQHVILISIILLVSIIASYLLIHTFRTALNELTRAALKFQQGDYSARCSYQHKNEFGILSDSFNAMVDRLQKNIELSTNTSSLASVMLSHEEDRLFFHATLEALAIHTGAQTAAVYLLSKDQKFFELYESIGMDGNAKKVFDALSYEGEFGVVLSSLKRQYISKIPENTQFLFTTPNGKYVPREMIAIPIIAGKQIIAIISLSTVSSFYEHSLELIDTILVTMSARIAGVLAYHSIKEFQKELENRNQELEIQKAQLAEASRLKTNFLSNMSHELRTPLNSIIALSGVLSRRLTNIIPEEEWSFLEVIERNGKNLLSLINDILDISRIEAGREKVDVSTIYVEKLIREIVTMLQPQAEQKGIQLIQERSDPELQFTSDADKCLHILQNIIGNAIKFTDKGSVKVTADMNGETMVITVSDTGIGIEARDLSAIFEEFRQVDGSISRRYGGTGLGLAIAKKYAVLLGGDISVKSTPDIGSVFTITLPLFYDEKVENRPFHLQNNIKVLSEKSAGSDCNNDNPAQSITDGKSGTLQNRKSGERPTILIVEDNKDNMITAKTLLDEKYSVLQAVDGFEGVNQAEKYDPDLILMDISLPGISGIEAFKRIRNLPNLQHIPIVALTASAMLQDRESILSHGFDAFIAKPIISEEFYRVIDEVLNGY